MLRISKLSIQNFGPYKGRHELTFSSEDGVTIVWGDNGFGKTSIMNAFRYVLWGRLYGRKRQHLQPHTFVNLPSLPDKEDMRVELHMNHNGKDCIVTRGLKRMYGNGEAAEDYTEIFSVMLGTVALNKEESKEFLAAAFPDRISRFYLFDGELLSEYEDLLDEQDESGAIIKKSIEDILGIPILENAKKNVDTIRANFSKEATNLAKKEQSTLQTSASLEASEEELKHKKESIDDLKVKLEEQKQEHSRITGLMEANTLFASYVKSKSDKETQLERDVAALDAARVKLGIAIDDSWRILLNTIIDDAIECLNSSVADIREKSDKSKALMSVSEFVLSSMDSDQGNCPVCNSELSDSVRAGIRDYFSQKSLYSVTEEEQKELSAASSLVAKLKTSHYASNKGEIQSYLERVDDLSISIDLLKSDLNDIKRSIADLGATSTEEEIQRLPSALEKCLNKIQELTQGIKSAENEKADLDAAIARLSAQIEKNSTNPDVKVARAKERFVSRLCELFEESISQFRDKLRDNVEKDASVFFKRIANDPEYDHLSINDNYGLQIVGTNGVVVPHRSSGYEQVVAISLISALHKNAPIEGPIFMDSTFQRVDGRHKQKIIENLHTFGHQVIVLAYNSEMGNVEDVKAALGSHLLKEYRLNHISSMETTIQ